MSQATLKILFIDEKRITSELEKAGYRKVGVQIFHALTFPQANDILLKGNIDIIVINFDYKGVDALALCDAFKRQEATATIPVVLTSVQSQPKHVRQRLPGPDLFMETPVPRDYFVEQIRTLLEESTRETDRVLHEGGVSFEFAGKRYECPIQDISKSGLLISADFEIESGTKLSLSFTLPGYKKPIKVDGEVVRNIVADPKRNTKAGIGVRFDDFNGDSLKRLEKFISKSQSDDPKLAYYL